MSATIVSNMKRLELCKAPLFPGSPSEYKYVPEKCVRLTKARGKTRKPRQLRRSQSLADLAEIKALAKITNTYIVSPLPAVIKPETAEGALRMLPLINMVVLRLFRLMISRAQRREHPNPNKRIVELYKSDEFIKTQGPLARHSIRYRVFLLVQTHLEEVSGTMNLQS